MEFSEIISQIHRWSESQGSGKPIFERDCLRRFGQRIHVDWRNWKTETEGNYFCKDPPWQVEEKLCLFYAKAL
jgi:hypothetical protein